MFRSAQDGNGYLGYSNGRGQVCGYDSWADFKALLALPSDAAANAVVARAPSFPFLPAGTSFGGICGG